MPHDHDSSDLAVAEAKRLVDEIREKHTSVVHDELEVIVNDLLHMWVVFISSGRNSLILIHQHIIGALRCLNALHPGAPAKR